MLRRSERLIMLASLCFRQATALVLVTMVFLFVSSATVHGTCADLASSQSVVAFSDGEIPPTQQDRSDHQADDSRHGQCCKCPCRGLKILISSPSLGLPGHDVGSSWYPPYNDCVIESPVSDIFQPPKLPA